MAGLATRRALVGLLGVSILSACSTLPSPGPGPSDPADPGPTGRLPEDLAREAAFMALGLVDTPYRYGGNTPAGGFDCSGLIVYVFRSAAGVALPRTVAQLARVGQPVRAASMRTGDLVLFDTTGRFSHAGIYVGDGRFVHAPSRGGVVRLDGVHTRYWRPRFSGVRRI
ncbi:MAG: C40 family peptidase [Burkholderiaceae bacterium]|nr:C40 family peptidase [Burkholderiaceae bacterium]